MTCSCYNHQDIRGCFEAHGGAGQQMQLHGSMSKLLAAMLQVAELAGIMGAKHTSFLIPLCHNISLKCAKPCFPRLLAAFCSGLRIRCGCTEICCLLVIPGRKMFMFQSSPAAAPLLAAAASAAGELPAA